ncbi:putative RDD family membrane protein YckC [Micromonospora kangleipakensis]|uniref:Putative RDD family membrane protein YckC n=1 Tax=Micromonospora kangleipakensis TaxID=1077942 RepID=A0A4Q8B4Y7_9ACTN|nr:RDD family protein [Micromonospora kangleipakensis]RZU72045.1 putative RDD family membrane protein YckC [Micromonospora kangleipakensis]
MTVQPGWYVDPAEPETRRYWDGEGWIGAPIPVDATPPEGPPPAEPTPAPPAAPPSPAPVSAGPGPGPHPGHPGAAQPGPGPWPGPGYAPGPGHPQGPPPGWPYPTWPGRPPEPRPHGLPLASYGVRLVARLIDFGILLLLNVAVNGWFVWRLIAEVAPFWQELWRRAETGDTTTAPPPPAGAQTDALWLAIVLIAAALWFAYEVPAMAASGQTFGKRVMRVRAVPIEADQPLGFGRATRRWSTLGLPTLLWYCAGFGLLLQFIDAVSPLFDHPLRQALHDKRAQTVVVQVPRGKPDTRTAPRDRANPPGDTP